MIFFGVTLSVIGGLQLFEEDPDIYRRADHWVEAADWIVWRLCGNYLRNTCTAGYKAVLQDDAYPSKDFLAALNEGRIRPARADHRQTQFPRRPPDHRGALPGLSGRRAD